MTEERGFEHLCDADGVAGRRESPTLRLRTLTVALAEGASPLVCSAFDGDPCGGVVLFDRTWGPGEKTRGTGCETSLPWLSPEWWALARDQFRSGMGSACGCGSGH